MCVYLRAAHARVASIGEKLVRRRQPNDFDIKSVTPGGSAPGPRAGNGKGKRVSPCPCRRRPA